MVDIVFFVFFFVGKLYGICGYKCVVVIISCLVVVYIYLFFVVVVVFVLVLVSEKEVWSY